MIFPSAATMAFTQIMHNFGKRSLFEKANDLHFIVGKMRNQNPIYQLGDKVINLYQANYHELEEVLFDLKNQSLLSHYHVIKMVSHYNYKNEISNFMMSLINQMKEKIIENPNLLYELNEKEESLLNLSLHDKSMLKVFQNMLFSLEHNIDENYGSPIPIFTSFLKEYNFTHLETKEDISYQHFNHYFYPILMKTKMDKFIINETTYNALLDLIAFECLYYKNNYYEIFDALIDLKIKHDFINIDKNDDNPFVFSHSQLTLDYINVYQEKYQLENMNVCSNMKELLLVDYLKLKNTFAIARNENEVKKQKL
jgi:hypothetical protein